MRNDIIRWVIIFGALATIGIITFQAYWVVNTWNINEEEFNNKVNVALLNVAESLASLKDAELPTREIITRRTTNYYVVNIEDEIDANHLEYYLQKEFEAKALNIDFEYAVYDCTTNKMVYGNYCSYSPEDQEVKELGNLPKYDKFTYYFGVKFPTRSGYLFGKMQLSIFFTLTVLITIIFFVWSTFVILRQKQLSELQKDFINNMTHEFKTPISTIKISADVFLNNPEIKADKRLYQYANIIKDQNLRLNNQVEKVLQLAKIEGDSFKLNPEKIDLNEFLLAIVESTQLRVEKMQGLLETKLPESPVYIYADQLHFGNILHNLLDNALKYCETKPHIQLNVAVETAGIQLSITDNGIGIEPEHQKRIFDKFYRVPTGNVHNVKGFGLGLYYVKNICQAHGWKILLESNPGKGSTIQLNIPKLP
jgi:two-component system phosphate regulon sensor histidine kinase PhoR